MLTVINEIEERNAVGALSIGEVGACVKLLVHDPPVGRGVAAFTDSISAGQAVREFKIDGGILNPLSDRAHSRMLDGKIIPREVEQLDTGLLQLGYVDTDSIVEAQEAGDAYTEPAVPPAPRGSVQSVAHA